MQSESKNKAALFAAYTNAATEVAQWLNRFSNEAINKVPYADSWTAAQVAQHLIKANNSIAVVFEKRGIESGSDKGKIENLKKVFLNFEHSLQSPDFILPEERVYEKETLITALRKSFEDIMDLAHKVNVNETVSHQVLGNMPKIDMIQFIIYHTERHIHQLKKIYESIAG